MEYSDIIAAVRGKKGPFIVTTADGKKTQRRLFAGARGREECLGEFWPGARTRGRYIPPCDTDDIISVVPLYDTLDILKKNLKRISSLLAKSGLWPEMKAEADKFLSFPDDTLRSYMGAVTPDEWKAKEAYIKEHEIRYFKAELFGEVKRRGCIIAIPYGARKDYDKDQTLKAIQECRDGLITEENPWILSWRKGYDNRITVQADGSQPCGWYSALFKDSMNGHYYFLLDEGHALYAEKD